MSKRYYDSDPRVRRRKSRRRRADPRVKRGRVPPQLRAWVFRRRRRADPRVRRTRRRRADPGFARTVRSGPRGGWYFAGPKKRRYDPRRRGFARRAVGKVEGAMNKYGRWIGGGLGLLAGILTGYNEYAGAYGAGNAWKNYWASIIGGKMADGTQRTPEISKLWGSSDALWGGGTVNYLKYKFLGLDGNNNYIGSAWSIPFIVSLIGTLAAPVAKIFTNKGQRILKPISRISQGALVVSTIGALALPGSPPYSGQLGSPASMTGTGGNVPFPKSGGGTNSVLV